MAKGDQADFVARIKAVLPARWFPLSTNSTIVLTPGSAGSIDDGAGNVYTLTSGYVAENNGQPTPGGYGTAQLVWYNGQLYGQDASSGNWFTYDPIEQTWDPATAPPANQASTTPILDGVLSGLASAWAGLYSLLQFVRQQTRISTATGPFLDMIAQDFFGAALQRQVNEGDALFATRIKAAILQPRATRQALINALVALTGRTPNIFEPGYTNDTGGYGTGDATTWTALAYNNYGGYGSLVLPFQFFCTAYRPHGGGIANAAGYLLSGNGSPGGYGSGTIEYASLSMIQGEVTDAMIFALIAQMIPAGVIGYTNITN